MRESGEWLASRGGVEIPTIPLAVWFLAASVAGAQNLSIGGLTGTNLTANFEPFPGAANPSYADTRTLLAGAAAEWSLAGPLAIEVDAVYRRLHELEANGSSFSVVTWEFPVLAKYRWRERGVAPFVEAGPAFRATGNLNDIHPSHEGFSAGLGIARQVGRWRIEPAVRYTRWARDVEASQTNIRTRADQLELLVGLRAGGLANRQPLGANVSVGLVAGTNVTGDFRSVSSLAFPAALANSGYIAEPVNATFHTSAGPRSFVGGPLVAVKLPKRLAVEVEGIYRPWRSSVEAFLPDGRKYLTYEDHRTTWEFPVLGQYRWRIGPVDPFLEMGPAFRLLQDVYGAAPYGVAVGAGVETRVGRLRIAPGLRFTQWRQSKTAAATNPERSEVAVLTGLGF